MELRVARWSEMDRQTRLTLLSRSESSIDSVVETVEEIIADVRARGDAAIRELGARLDGFDDTALPLRVQDEEFDRATDSLSRPVLEALEYAIANVRTVHQRQKPSEYDLHQVRSGVLAGERTTPIDSVGLYVPRGRGSFPSMLYMLAIPAVIAGVPRVAVVTPPSPDGSIDAACLHAARLCGVSEVYRAGGAQAIAALAFGTESIRPVVKVVGPGSAYVAAAKRLLRDTLDVGLPAGPSESAILSDETGNPVGIARDLLIEAEHGNDSQAILVTPSRELVERVAEMLPSMVERTPEPRRTFLESVFSTFGIAILSDDIEQACEIVNELAPEHLQLRTADPWHTIASIRNAGEILLGPDSAFSLANYAAGANAVLPTGGFARTWSGVSVHDFQKRSSIVQVSREGFPDIARHVETLADYEGFYWHREALRSRG